MYVISNFLIAYAWPESRRIAEIAGFAECRYEIVIGLVRQDGLSSLNTIGFPGQGRTDGRNSRSLSRDLGYYRCEE